MAVYVCYRTCGRHAFQQLICSLKSSTHVMSSPAPLLSRSRTLAMLSFSYLGQGARFQFHHAAGYRSLKKGVTDTRSGIWRGFRSQRTKEPIERKDPIESEIVRHDPAPSNSKPGLLRPFLFTAFVCGSSFFGSMIWQYEALRQKSRDVVKGINRQFGNMFEPAQHKEMGFRAHMNSIWNRMSDGQKMVIGLISLNTLVFLGWKAPSLHPFLMRYFASAPGNPTVSMLLSSFSHYNLWHLGANMYVLWSFANVSLDLLGREQWLAVYLSSATISSLASMVNKTFRPGLVGPSLGASGAIMCLLGAVCVTHPDARLSIAFVGDLFPHSFSASSALKFILLLDTAGLVMGWRVFDHAAHLGGVLFGMWYVTYGHKMIWGQRERFMRWWHQVRSPPKD